jgi:hypothetical protein
MLEFSGPDPHRVVTITASGKLTRADYDRSLPALEALLDDLGKLRFYIVLENVTGFELGALWEDLKFDLKYRDRFGRMAIVGDRKWEEWAARLSRPFFSEEVRFFYADRAAEARAWING